MRILKSIPIPLFALILALAVSGIISGIFFRYLAPYLALSLPAIERGWVWQLITYPFVLTGPIGWSHLLSLAGNLLVLWVFGSAVIEQKSAKFFLLLFFSASLVSGLTSLIGMINVPFFLFGPTPALFAVLVVWMMIYPISQTRLVIGILMGIDLLLHLIQGAWILLIANASGALFGFLFYKIWHFKRAAKEYHPTKIYDIRSGQPVLPDDAFMDAMLEKISLYGKNSLTPEEKKRMQLISEKKSK